MKRIVSAALAAVLAASSIALTSCSSGSTDLADYGDDNYKQYVTVGQYKGIEIERTQITVTQDDIDAEVREWLSGFADIEDMTASDVIALGDTVEVKFTGTVKEDSESYKAGYVFTTTGEKTSSVTIGSGAFIPGFEDALIGYHVGDEFEFDITLPEGYQNDPKLGGVLTTFKIEVVSGTHPNMPEYTDEFVAENTTYKTMADYEEYLRGVLTEQAEEDALVKDASAVWEKVMANSTVIKYPEPVVKARVESLKQEYTAFASANYQMTLEEYVQANNSTMEVFENSLRSQCELQVFEEMVLNYIIALEGITLTDAEYEEMAADYAADRNMSLEEFEQYYGVEEIRQSLIWDKTILFLVENSKPASTSGSSANE